MTTDKIIPLVDSHCHLNLITLDEFDNQLDVVLAKARAVGVERFLCVSVVLENYLVLSQLAERYRDVYFSVGVHPDSPFDVNVDAQMLIEKAQHPQCIAIGETGLDYYRIEAEDARDCQQQRFREHIRASIATGKPLIIHTRQAAEDTLRLMREENAQSIGGVMHCFTESWEIAKQALDLNFYISFSGILTFKNATTIQDVARKVPASRMLIETDSPYLAPVPFRGKQNHPEWVAYVARMLADLREVEYETIATQTTENFYRCFRLPQLVSPITEKDLPS
jgi:TatD DNase family protein